MFRKRWNFDPWNQIQKNRMDTEDTSIRDPAAEGTGDRDELTQPADIAFEGGKTSHKTYPAIGPQALDPKKPTIPSKMNIAVPMRIL